MVMMGVLLAGGVRAMTKGGIQSALCRDSRMPGLVNTVWFTQSERFEEGLAVAHP